MACKRSNSVRHRNAACSRRSHQRSRIGASVGCGTRRNVGRGKVVGIVWYSIERRYIIEGSGSRLPFSSFSSFSSCRAETNGQVWLLPAAAELVWSHVLRKTTIPDGDFQQWISSTPAAAAPAKSSSPPRSNLVYYVFWFAVFAEVWLFIRMCCSLRSLRKRSSRRTFFRPHGPVLGSSRRTLFWPPSQTLSKHGKQHWN